MVHWHRDWHPVPVANRLLTLITKLTTYIFISLMYLNFYYKHWCSYGHQEDCWVSTDGGSCWSIDWEYVEVLSSLGGFWLLERWKRELKTSSKSWLSRQQIHWLRICKSAVVTWRLLTIGTLEVRVNDLPKELVVKVYTIITNFGSFPIIPSLY